MPGSRPATKLCVFFGFLSFFSPTHHVETAAESGQLVSRRWHRLLLSRSAEPAHCARDTPSVRPRPQPTLRAVQPPPGTTCRTLQRVTPCSTHVFVLYSLHVHCALCVCTCTVCTEHASFACAKPTMHALRTDVLLWSCTLRISQPQACALIDVAPPPARSASAQGTCRSRRSTSTNIPLHGVGMGGGPMT